MPATGGDGLTGVGGKLKEKIEAIPLTEEEEMLAEIERLRKELED